MPAWRARLVGPDGERTVLIEASEESTRGDLVAALADLGCDGASVFVEGEEWTPGDPRPLALRHGVVLGWGGRGGGRSAVASFRRGSVQATRSTTAVGGGRGVVLVVVAGPAAGVAFELPVVIGRGVVDDPLLSSAHFAIDADRSVRDLGSRNGTVCDGRLLSQGVLEPGMLVHAGSSLFALVELDPSDPATWPAVPRRFREALADLAEPPPQPPEHDDDSTGAWWRALLPIGTALGMGLVTGRWWFLVIAAVAPLVYGYDTLRRNRRRRTRATVEVARFTAAVARYRTAEVRRARQRHGGGGVAVRLAAVTDRRLWERRPGDADFGAVTLGFAARPSAFQERGYSEAGPALLWRAPLVVDLATEGPLGVVGPAARVEGVLRALAVDLCAAHAPPELNLWVLTEATRADGWAFAQWLPHTFTDAAGQPGGARIATTPEGRAALVRSLRSVIDARRAEAQRHHGHVTMVPLHVVVVDRVDLVEPCDLAGLLGDGPAVGVVTIVGDTAVLPDGARAEVRLGDQADECSYRSVRTPRVEAVAVAQLTPGVALDAALALAPLEALAPGAARPLGSAHLTELVALAARTPADQAAFWRANSPCTHVPVGLTSDGAALLLDFVRDGPHGLIGGMTRSGKTEFLKTWFAALAVHNHPDDLAIVVVDFKGGVDHRAVSGLPHVIALATNQDIDVFERTLTLLGAELERRQRLFTDVARVATLEGYRTARAARPELPPVPRLLMVVDEFAELLETPEGRAGLGRLESTARIGAGLGVHLLLLTQLFDHALPPTIDAQAGLRVCFKVQHAEHSNVVLRSPVAASIAAHAKGRAFARFQGGELVEFQTARVGNAAAGSARRSPANAPERAVTVRAVTLADLAWPAASEQTPEVPNEQQDLFRVVELVQRAAALDGFSGEAMPWPGELPESLALTDLPDGAIGLADDPARQRRVPLQHRFADDVVLYAGANGSGHHDALVTTAVALALAHQPDELHLYGIDALGHGLAQLADLPHTGTVATRDEATALRILHHLAAEGAARRGAPAHRPQIILLVLGLDRLFLHGEGSTSPLLAPLTTLVNEAAGTGIQVVCSGTHAMLANRIGVAAARRLVFRAHDPLEYPPSVPRLQRAQLTVPLRCADSGTGLVAQLAGLAPSDAAALRTAPTSAAGPRPRAFTRTPWPLPIDAIRHDRCQAPVVNPGVPLGVCPDSGEPIMIDPAEDGLAWRIVGPPKSGRSSALLAIAVLARRSGWDVVAAAAGRRSPLTTHPALAGSVVPVGELPELVGHGPRPTVVLVDDAHRLDDEYPWRKFATVETSTVVTIVAGATDTLSRTLGVMRTLNAPGGVVLMPTRSRDADPVGVRQIDDGWLVQPLPGVGVAGICGEAHRVQFPFVQ